MTAYTFDQIIDFTRTSAATYVANTGFVTQTPASRNLLTYTQEFDNAAWVRANATVSANVTVAPDGTQTADKLVETTTTAEFILTRTPTLSPSTTYTFSCYMKAAERTFGVLNIYTGAASCWTWFNLSTGVVSTLGSGATATITAVGNGWYRCTLTIATAATGTPNVAIFPAATNGVTFYAGTAGNGIFIWGAQLEAASAASTYTRNNGGVYPPRFDYDPVTLAPRGLLVEEQRTNFLIGSADFTNATAWAIDSGIVLTANADTAPTGTAVACQVAFGAGSRQLWSMALGSPPTGTLTASIYIKGTAGETIKFGLVGDEGIYTLDGTWQRLTRTSSTYTAARVTVNTYSGVTARTVLVWGAQLEAGAFATSYIPTAASQVTRTADQAAVTGANFASWYNSVEGTFIFEGDSNSLVSGRFPGVLQVTDGTSSNRIGGYISQASGAYVAQRTLSGAVAVGVTANATAQNTVFKAATAFSASAGVSAALNGGTVASGAASAFPSVNQLNLGMFDDRLNGHIRRIRYYPTRLSNTQLQALTA